MRTRDIVLIALVGSAAGLVTVEVTRLAWAAGVPTQSPLTYSGRLTEGGAPVNGERPIHLFLWDDATSTEAAHRRCATIPAAPVMVREGRFEVALDGSCRGVVERTPELWSEVLVSGTSMGRTKIGAVPYALEAQRAVSVERPVYTNPSTGARWSLNASFCGATDRVTGAFRSGDRTGYPAAKALCEATCGSPTAHMCTGEELVRFVSTGGDIPDVTGEWGWYSSGIHNHYSTASVNFNTYECNAFTYNGGQNNLASVWNSRDSRPAVGWCSDSYAILCCD